MNFVAIAPRLRSREDFLSEIRCRLVEKGKNLRQAITERNLYFRVSLVGTCNLSCEFCHNEGALKQGKLDLAFAIKAMKSAFEIGFSRVQFTGGEPLLHHQVSLFVSSAKQIFPDVGITTNGTYLNKHIDTLVESGITRIHISLQYESLMQAGHLGKWGCPDWLFTALSYAVAGRFKLRINLPVPIDMLSEAKSFLEEMAKYGCDLQVFSILPEGKIQDVPYSIDKLIEMVKAENQRRGQLGQQGTVFLRDYRPPNGIRCESCQDYPRCKEQSHSLRLGADRVLRPCLATRDWDNLLDEHNMRQQIEEAALLATDY